ncbi:MAG TPA: hypothetical protein DCS93_36795 [Microscillaceae bacterium]|nr:hypothetical protein [Microscillaceae bacterium]
MEQLKDFLQHQSDLTQIHFEVIQQHEATIAEMGPLTPPYIRIGEKKVKQQVKEITEEVLSAFDSSYIINVNFKVQNQALQGQLKLLSDQITGSKQVLEVKLLLDRLVKAVTQSVNSHLPVIFTAYANPDRDLKNLNKEEQGIQDLFMPLLVNNRIQNHLSRYNTDLKSYFEFLRLWREKITIFHFGGHVNSDGLVLQNIDAFFKPLAQELSQRNPASLKLVFLNGCSTKAHVQTLFDLGIKAVIATSVDVEDATATDFALHFYEELAAGHTIGEAYQSASNFIKSGSQEIRFQQLGEIVRGSKLIKPKKAEDFPWALYLHPKLNDASEALSFRLY